jgi:polyphosphate kinase
LRLSDQGAWAVQQLSMITIQLNGDAKQIPPGLNLLQLLDLLELPPDRVAIEHNLSIVRKPSWEATNVSEGDRLEIVHFVGGGAGQPVPGVDLSTLPLDHPSLYVNRELSLLQFQRRVLEEASDAANPLLERVKFLSILGSNLDEFFMVRVAGLKQQAEAGLVDTGPDGMSVGQQLEAIRVEVEDIVRQTELLWSTQLAPELEKEQIRLRSWQQLSSEQQAQVSDWFHQYAFPVLTPLAVDPARPFPHISNLSLNLAVFVRDGETERFARIKVPDTLPQLVPLEPQTKRGHSATPHHYVWLEEVIAAHLQELFPQMNVLESHPFHITRNADVAIQELEADDLLEEIAEGVRARRFGDIVRLQLRPGTPQRLVDLLVDKLEIDAGDVYEASGPMPLVRLRAVAALERRDLKERPFTGRLPRSIDKNDDLFVDKNADLLADIRQRDLLLHHPFDSFEPVVHFLRQAARDPQVLAIKMTLYRVGRSSPVVEALLEANDRGKQVAVLVELKARFDEESNIEWARKLENAGVHVVYGLPGLKIHAKIALVVRREGDVLRRYVHLGTGNYNAVTASLYTDLGLFTTDEVIADDASNLFNFLTGYSKKKDYRKLLVAPINLQEKFVALLKREIEHQRHGREARIVLKMNALVHREIIQLLYEASRAGVKVDLIVRGVCCLRPGLPGISENIRVISVLGRFLEHHRIFYFANGGRPELYLGSADMMPRNIHRRVETLFPVEDAGHIRFLRDELLESYCRDESKARFMQPDGTYVRSVRRRESDAFDAQQSFLRQPRAALRVAPRKKRGPRAV